MKRLLVVIALVTAAAAPAAALLYPPKSISPVDAERLLAARLIEPVHLVDTQGRRPIIGFLLPGIPGERIAGAYVWSAPSKAYVEFHVATLGVQFGGLRLPVAETFRPVDRQLLREYIPTLYLSQQNAPTPPAASRPAPAAKAAPLPQPTVTAPTFLDRVLLAASSRALTFWTEHRILSILGLVVLSLVLGSRVRTRGPRPIEVRQDEVLAALAASEQKLTASRARLQELSTAIDAEEAKFVERVSAIVERR